MRPASEPFIGIIDQDFKMSESDESADDVIVLGKSAEVVKNDLERKRNKKKKKKAKKGNDIDSSEDELCAMMQFIGDYEGIKERKGDQTRVWEDQSTRATREMTRKYQGEQQALKLSKERQQLLELTKKNLAAAESVWRDDQEGADGDEEEEQVTRKDGEYLNDCVKKGDEYVQGRKYEEAVEAYKEALKICQANLEQTAWAQDVNGKLATTFLGIGNVRDAIKHFVEALRLLRSAGDKKEVEKEENLLVGLVTAYSDIGRMTDAEQFEKELAVLRGKAEQPRKKKTEKKNYQKKAVVYPQELSSSLDQAIESAFKGQFGFLRALLNAFREGRGDLTLKNVVDYQHSKTGVDSLMVSAAKGQTDLVKALLSAGSRVDQTASDGSNALVWACRFDHHEAVGLLLDAGSQFTKDVTAIVLESWSPHVRQTVSNFVEAKKKQLKSAKVAAVAPPKPPPVSNENKGDNNKKQLEKWNDESAEKSSTAKPLESEKVDKDWSQFDANKHLGVKMTNFDENLYTTRLDVETIPEDVKAKAEALCKTIEKSKASRVAAGKPDEETLYSSVQRVDEAGKSLVEDDGFTDVSVRKKNKKKNRTNSKN